MIHLWWWDDNRLHDQPPPPERRPKPQPGNYAWVRSHYRQNRLLGWGQLLVLGVLAGLVAADWAEGDVGGALFMVVPAAATLYAYRLSRRLRRRLITLAETYGVEL